MHTENRPLLVTQRRQVAFPHGSSAVALWCLLCACSLAIARPAAAQNDVTSEIEHIGDPIGAFYEKKLIKSGVAQIQLYNNKLYVAHGSMDNDDPTRVIYYDLALQKWDYVKKDNGDPLLIWEEKLAPIRVFDGELYYGSIDPNRGATKFIRLGEDGTWTIKTIGLDAHNREVMKFDGKIFIHHGRWAVTYPSMLISDDDGNTWNTPQQPDVSAKHMGYQVFFTFNNQFYVSSFAPHFLSRYTGVEGSYFEIVHEDRSALLGRGFKPIYDAAQVQDRLVFYSDRLYTTTSLTDPSKVQPIPLDGGRYADDIQQEGETVYVLTTSSKMDAKGKWTQVMEKTTDGTTLEEVFRFKTPFRNVVFEYVEGDFYFGAGGTDGYFWRVTRAAYENEETPLAVQEIALRQGWNLISSRVQPAEASLDNVFADVMPHVAEIRSEAGRRYLPGQEVKELDQWNALEGYFVYVTANCTLQIEGAPLPSGGTLTLKAGWNVMPYFGVGPRAVEDVLGPAISKVRMVKDHGGRVYIPGHGINDIGDLQPGRGYKVYVSSSAELTY